MSIDISTVPKSLNGLRACKLCKLIKTFDDVLSGEWSLIY